MPGRLLPMGRMSPWVLDEAQARDDLDELAALLAPRTPLDEKDNILPFFQERADLCALMSMYNWDAQPECDRLGGEISFLGQYRADLVVGNMARRAYAFFEFEDAKETSIFRRTNNQQPPWSPRCERAMSQTVDWLWLMDTHPGSPLLRQMFGSGPITVTAVLVLGRDHWLVDPIGNTKSERLEWRRTKTIVNNHKIYICTFDELLNDLRGRAQYSRTLAATPPPPLPAPAIAPLPPPPAAPVRPPRARRRRRP